jgi:hypothetical protein
MRSGTDLVVDKDASSRVKGGALCADEFCPPSNRAEIAALSTKGVVYQEQSGGVNLNQRPFGPQPNTLFA